MDFTVRQAFQVETLVRGQVLAGHRGLDKPIERVRLLEMESTNPPKGQDLREVCQAGDFLFASLPFPGDGGDETTTLLEILARNGCSGLAVEPAPGWSELRSSLLSLADQLELPLIELPSGVSITQVVVDLVEWRYDHLRRAEKAHLHLTRVALEERGLKALAEAVGCIVERPVVITDRNLHPLTEGGAGAAALRMTLPQHEKNLWWIVRQVREQTNKAQSAETWRKTWRLEGVDNGDDEALLVLPLLSGGGLEGFLIVGEQGQLLTEQDYQALFHAASVVVLELLKQRAVLEAENQLRRDFIDDLLGGRLRTPQAILSRAHFLGWELQDKRMVLLLEHHSVGDESLIHLDSVVDQPNEPQQGIRRCFRTAVDAAVAAENPGSLVVEQGERLVVLLQLSENVDTQEARERALALAQAIQRHALQQKVASGVSIGIGGFCMSYQKLPESYQQAQQALGIGKRLGEQQITFFADVHIYVLLARLATDPELQSWYQRTIGPLVDYDRRNNTELMRSMECYFDNSQALQQTAHQLYIHPKTLHYRLRRIREILGVDPFTGENQLSFYLAAKLSRLM